MFSGYHLHRTVPKIAEAMYCLIPSLVLYYTYYRVNRMQSDIVVILGKLLDRTIAEAVYLIPSLLLYHTYYSIMADTL